MKNLSWLMFLILGMSSCNVKTSYTVWVKNSTGEDLTIAFKTLNEYEQGEVAKTIILKNGAAETILRTKDFDAVAERDEVATKPCAFVAEYMKFMIRNNVESKLKWCDPTIKLETVDIGQDEFMIDLSLADFPVD